MAETARVTIDLDRTIGIIDRNIFGGFIEHLGRGIYGGIFDEGSPLADEQGFRTDVMTAVRGLHMPVLRWPGGNFVSGYLWTDGIGPVDERPRRIEMAWHGEESNRFGTDEFIAYCRAIGTEPYICVNMGTGTMEEARSWVEYCNGTGNTYWANRRRANGHDEPFNVRYWGLGNEVYGKWQIGALGAEDYVSKAREFAKVMLWTDPTIELIGCGQNGWEEWDRTVLEGLHEFVSYHSIHLYTGSDDFSENVYQPHIAEFAIAAVATEIERLRFRHRSKRQIRIAYDEWNVWYRARTAETHLEEHYSLSDALAVGAFLNIFVRHCDVVGMANLAQLVNVIAPIFTSPDGMYLQTIYHPLHLMAEHVQRLAITTWYDGPRKELPEIPAMPVRTKNASQLGPFDVIDVSASRSMDCSTATVSLINRHETDAIATTLDFGKGSLTGTALRFEVNGRDITATNDFGDEGGTYVTETQEPVSGSELQVTLPAHSHTFLKLSLAPTS